jgi:2-polyprenyl-3-methyl-5-hydroxy-6-metoxy-1,4-benzoquinol methylase
MVEVLEHIPNWRVALRNAGRVLRDKGILYLTAPNAKADLRKNDLHEEELEVHEMRARLLEYFTGVEVKDYALNDETENTTKTPVLFLARK